MSVKQTTSVCNTPTHWCLNWTKHHQVSYVLGACSGWSVHRLLRPADVERPHSQEVVGVKAVRVVEEPSVVVLQVLKHAYTCYQGRPQELCKVNIL